MPIYTYKCEKCGLEIERLQEKAENQPVPCPDGLKKNEECQSGGESTLKRIIGKPSAHFSGDGFYSNRDDAKNPASS